MEEMARDSETKNRAPDPRRKRLSPYMQATGADAGGTARGVIVTVRMSW